MHVDEMKCREEEEKKMVAAMAGLEQQVRCGKKWYKSEERKKKQSMFKNAQKTEAKKKDSHVGCGVFLCTTHRGNDRKICKRLSERI